MQNDLISRQSLMSHFATSQALVNDRDVLYCNGVLDAISREPSVDAVPVVRCKDCKLRGEPKECYMCFAEVEDIEGGRMYKFTDLTQDDGFCHRGAKMDGGANDADTND